MLVGITESMERPFIKWVENQSELEQAFSLVHEEYLRAGYIKENNTTRIFFNIHNLLPNSATRKHHGDLLESCIPKADRQLRM